MTTKLSEEPCWSEGYEMGGGDNGGVPCPEQIAVYPDINGEPIERPLRLDEYCETCRAKYN